MATDKCPTTPTVEEIVKEYLVNNGYDGLFYDDGHEISCDCDIHGKGNQGFMPCGTVNDECSCGYINESMDDNVPMWRILPKKGE